MSEACNEKKKCPGCLYGHNCKEGGNGECEYYYPINCEEEAVLLEREVEQCVNRGYHNIASNVYELAGLQVYESYTEYVLHERETNAQWSKGGE